MLPIHIIALYLLLLAVGALISSAGSDATLWFTSLRNLVLIVLPIIALRLLGRRFVDGYGPSRQEHTFITVAILFLLFDPFLTWWNFILLGAITELIRFLVRRPGAPLFNPAAAGLLALTFFDAYPSWWGTNFAPRFSTIGEGLSIAVLLTLPIAGYVAYRYRKLPLVLSAIAAFAIVYSILLEESPWYIILEGTFLFFVLVMVAEPKTSPIDPTEQYIYGALIGTLVPIGLLFHFPEAYLIALLAGNAYTSRRFFITLFKSKEVMPSTPAAPAA